MKQNLVGSTVYHKDFQSFLQSWWTSQLCDNLPFNLSLFLFPNALRLEMLFARCMLP